MSYGEAGHSGVLHRAGSSAAAGLASPATKLPACILDVNEKRPDEEKHGHDHPANKGQDLLALSICL